MSQEPQHTTTNAIGRRSTWQANIRLTQWLRLALILTVVPVPLFGLRLFGLVPLYATAFLSCLYGLLVVLLLAISWVVDRALADWVVRKRRRQHEAATTTSLSDRLDSQASVARRCGRIMQIGGVVLLVVSAVFVSWGGFAGSAWLDFSHFLVGGIAFIAAGTDVRQRAKRRAGNLSATDTSQR
jgi:hypothetical protein